jgi:hypothetical protein
MRLAQEVAGRSVRIRYGNKCFFLDVFLAALGVRLDEWIGADGTPVSCSHIGPGSLARYLWACLAVQDGTSRGEAYFQGMEIERE